MTNTAEFAEADIPKQTQDTRIQFPLGILGFEDVKDYVLLARPNENPFLWLQMLDNPNHAFLVIPPFAVEPGYQPDISEDDVRFLHLHDPADALVLNIVTLRPGATPTANLKGPIVINRLTCKAKQVIPVNAAQLPLNFPLPVAN